jgi:hypothetical protein
MYRFQALIDVFESGEIGTIRFRLETISYNMNIKAYVTVGIDFLRAFHS